MVSVIIVAYKRFALFDKLLRAWYEQENVDEIIVLDNSEQDHIHNMIALSMVPVKKITPSSNLGPQGKYPLAFFAKNEWVLYVDDDIMPKPGLVKDLQKYSNKEIVVSIIGRKFTGSTYFTSEGFRSENISTPLRVDWVGGGCCLAHRSLGAVNIAECPDKAVDDWWWQRHFDVTKIVAPTKKYSFTSEFKDEYAIHTKQSTKDLREYYYRLWIGNEKRH